MAIQIGAKPDSGFDDPIGEENDRVQGIWATIMVQRIYRPLDSTRYVSPLPGIVHATEALCELGLEPSVRNLGEVLNDIDTLIEENNSHLALRR